MAYTYASVVINFITYTAKRAQTPTISYSSGGTAGSEVVTVAADLSNIDIKIQSGVTTNTQIATAIANAKGTSSKSLYASDLISVAITGGHEADAATTIGAQTMTGASQTPAPTMNVPVFKSAPILSTVIDWSISWQYQKTLSANTTFTFVNSFDGMEISVVLTNTASNYTVTWPAGIKWVGGSAPTQTIGAKSDVYTFRQIGSTIYGTAVQNLS